MSEKDFFQKLRTSILLFILKQETSEPQVVAVEGLSDESARITRISQYAADIERVLKEMLLVQSLISELPPDSFLRKHNINPEDYILYHYGSFLNLIHQLKDKIAHLCDGTTTTGIYKERKDLRKKSLMNQILEKVEVKSINGLSEELGKWRENENNPIGWGLGKRTRHQHFRSMLTLDRNLLDVKMYRTFFHVKSSESVLSEYGRKFIEEKGKKGLISWHENIKKDVKSIVEFVQESLNIISEKLYDNCNLPNIDKEKLEIASKHNKMLSSLKIKNLCKRDKVDPRYDPVIKVFELGIPKVFQEKLLCMYLVGSVSRGDANFPHSDINFVIVFDDDQDILLQVLKNTLSRFTNYVENLGLELDVKILLKKDFLSAENRKARFICKTDGIILWGNEIYPKEKFPKPGLKLALLLNSGSRRKLQHYVDLFGDKTKSFSQKTIDKAAVDVSKISLRVMYSAVMSDTAIYERNLDRMKDRINEKYPQGNRLTDTVHAVATRKAKINLESLEVLLDGYKEGGSLDSVLKQIEEKNIQLENRKKFK